MLMTPPKGNRGRNRARCRGENASRPLTDPGKEMRLVAPSVDASVRRDWCQQPKHREPVSVALADDQFVSYISPRRPGVSPAGKAGFFFFFFFLGSRIVCSAWPNFCLRCYEAFNCAL